MAAGWNGTTWSLERTASPAGALRHVLGSVSCAPAGPCTAVGYYQAHSFFTPAETRP